MAVQTKIPKKVENPGCLRKQLHTGLAAYKPAVLRIQR